MDSAKESKRGVYVKVKGSLLFPDVFDGCVKQAKLFQHCEDDAQAREICATLLQQLKAQPLSFTFLFAQSCTFIVNPLADLIVKEEALNPTTLELGYMLLNSGIAREAASSFFFKCFDVLMGVLHQHTDDHDDGFPLYAAKIMCTAIHIVDEVELVAKGIVKSTIFWHAIRAMLLTSHADAPQGALVALLYLARQCLSVVPITRAIIDDVDSVLKCATTCEGPFSNSVIRCLAALFIALALSTEEDISSLTATLPKLAASMCAATSQGNVYMITVFSLARELVEDKKSSCYLRKINSAFSELKKRSFHTEGRLRSLERISGLLFHPESGKTESQAACVSTAAVVLIPGAVRALFSAICDVDEFTCGCACDIISKLLAITPHSYKGTSDAIFSAQLSAVQGLIEMGTIYLLEDILADYSVRATVSVLSLLVAFVKFSAVSQAAVTSSRCVQQVVHSIHQLAQKDNLEEYIHKDERCEQVTLYFELLSLTVGEEKTTIAESVLTDISTIISEARSVPVGEAGMRTLAKLTPLHPMAASLVLDFDFLHEGFAQDGAEAPSPLNRMLVSGSFGIMTEMVCVEASVITFEWIETLLAAIKRVGDWGDAALFASVWTCVAKTLSISEEAREYMLDDDTCALLEQSVDSVVHKLDEGKEEYLPCLTPLTESALYAPAAVGEHVLSALLGQGRHALPATVSFLLDLCAGHQKELSTPIWTATLVHCLAPDFVVGAGEEDCRVIEERVTTIASSNAEPALLFSAKVVEAVLLHSTEAPEGDGAPQREPAGKTPESVDTCAKTVDEDALMRFVAQTVETAVAADQCTASTGAALLAEAGRLLATLAPELEKEGAGLSSSALMRTIEVCTSFFAWAKVAEVKAEAPLQVEILASLLGKYVRDEPLEASETNSSCDPTAAAASTDDDTVKMAQLCSDLLSLDFVAAADFADNAACEAFVEKQLRPLSEQNEACHGLVLKLSGKHTSSS